MDRPIAMTDAKEQQIVYVRKVQVRDLPDELRHEAEEAGLSELYAIGDEEGQQLALVQERDAAFFVARQHDLSPVSVH